MTELDLQGNSISRIDSGAFSGLNSLRTLVLTGNELTEVTSSMFTGLPVLRSVYLGRNFITRLRYQTFAGLDSLVVLYLESNTINYIENEAFRNLNNLDTLGLDNNTLTSLRQEMFIGLDSMRLLRVDLNGISSLGDLVLSELPRPLILGLSNPFPFYDSLRDNPWVCSSFCWLKREEQRESVKWAYGVASTANDRVYFKPECVDGDWDAMRCHDDGYVTFEDPRQRKKSLT